MSTTTDFRVFDPFGTPLMSTDAAVETRCPIVERRDAAQDATYQGKFGALAGPCNHRLQAHRYIHRGREGLPVALIDWLAALSDARPDARCALDKLRVRVPRGAGSRPTREPAHRFEKLCKDGSRGRRRCDGGVFAEA